MFAAQSFAALLVIAASLLARADVTPTEPSPGDIFNAGSPCHATWLGDSNSTTIWKNMAIELMSGSNTDMIHITTVATGQDGTVDGIFTFTCPQVNPNSAIYFYQFSSPQTKVLTWTTRFTIASSTGATTPPPNATQPGSGDAIPWGVGALVDPSQAVAAPGSGNVTAVSTTPSVILPSSTSSIVKITTTPLVTPVDNSTATDSAPTGAASTKSSAVSVVNFDSRVWISAAAFAFAAFLW